MSHSLRITAFVAALSLAFAAGAQTAADPLADAQKLLRAGQLQPALEKTDALVAAKPKDAQGRFLRGLILTEMNRNAEAIAVFTKLTEDFPELPEPYNNLAVLYAQQKQYDKSRAALEMAIRTHPSYAIAHENLGDVYAKLASQAYDKALSIDSSNSAAKSKLSLIRDLISVSAKQTKPGVRPGEPGKLAVADIAKAAAAAPTPPKPALVAAAPAAAPAAAATPVAPAAVATPATPAAATSTPAAKPATAPVSAAPAAAPVAAAPAAVAKAPEKAAEKPVSKADAQAEITQAVRAWAHSWSHKDVKGYLAHYATDFETPNGEARKAWEADRAARIDKPGKISVELENIQISLNGADKATVKFRQHYRSATLKTATSKTLSLIRSGGKWLILQERVG